MPITPRAKNAQAPPPPLARPATRDEPGTTVATPEVPPVQTWLVLSDLDATPLLLPTQWHLPATFPAVRPLHNVLAVHVLRTDLERLLREMIVGTDAASRLRENSVKDGYHAALLIIAARVGDSELSAPTVAAELNTSARTLQRRFVARGTTVERSIRAARVLHARSLLEDPAYRSLTISRVARASGMRDGTTLARAFAKEHLASPSAYRAAPRTTL